MTNNNRFQQSPKEIRRETAYGPDKISLVLQFPSDMAKAAINALRQDVLAILEKELSQKELIL